jgi:hypothetical protein
VMRGIEFVVTGRPGVRWWHVESVHFSVDVKESQSKSVSQVQRPLERLGRGHSHSETRTN